MSDPVAKTGARRHERVDLDEHVTIHFESGSIVGPGQNISAQGVFFTAAAAIPVTVRIAGRDEAVAGELVRVESMGDGRVGIAVRFVATHPELAG
jgi:hypothetical protein